MMRDGYGLGAGGWLLMWLLGLTVVTLVVVAVGAAVRPVTRARLTAPPPAERILGARFARGEINADEYARRLRALRSQP